MNITQTIVDNVVRGLVLDERGKWVPLAQMKAIESGVLRHLAAGDVLFNGQWVSIRKCKELMAGGPQPRPGDLTMSSADAEHISGKKASPWVVVSLNTGEQHLAHDHYLRLLRQATAAEKEEQ
jgi:hypothetical protein